MTNCRTGLTYDFMSIAATHGSLSECFAQKIENFICLLTTYEACSDHDKLDVTRNPKSKHELDLCSSTPPSQYL
jgi:hypothetical protein